jgi:hypothetical protein
MPTHRPPGDLGADPARREPTQPEGTITSAEWADRIDSDADDSRHVEGRGGIVLREQREPVRTRVWLMAALPPQKEAAIVSAAMSAAPMWPLKGG